MDKVPTKYPPRTSQVHSEFPKPICLQFPQCRKWSVHSECPRSCDCSVPIRETEGTFKMSPKGVPMVSWASSFKEFFAVSQLMWLWCPEPGTFEMNQSSVIKVFLSGTFKMSPGFFHNFPLSLPKMNLSHSLRVLSECTWKCNHNVPSGFFTMNWLGIWLGALQLHF